MKNKGNEVIEAMGNSQSEEEALDALLSGLTDTPAQPEQVPATETLEERLARLKRELEETEKLVEAEKDEAFTARVKHYAEVAQRYKMDLRDVQAYIENNGRPKVWPSQQKDAPAPKKQKADLPPKYRDPASGKTWSGRGREPLWLAGRRDEFLIK